MRVSIIVPDGMVVVDGVGRKVSMEDVLPGVHAVQWNGRTGDVELSEPVHANIKIDDLSPYQFLLDRWTAAAPKPVDPPLPPTKDEQLARTLADPALDALIDTLAEKFGLQPAELRDDIKARMK